jgi:hypothetical protein
MLKFRVHEQRMDCSAFEWDALFEKTPLDIG